MIVLRGCGLKFKWRFPRIIKKCPVRNCKKIFMKRSDAIVHFKRKHAKTSTLCPICEVPLQIRRFGDIKYHYKRVHPNVELPTYFSRKSMDVDVDPQMEDVQSEPCSENESAAAKGMRLSCPLKFCSYDTMQMTDLCAHWTENHDELEFPEFRGEKQFAPAIDTQKPANERKVILLVNHKITKI